jgi:hypothetical protein
MVTKVSAFLVTCAVLTTASASLAPAAFADHGRVQVRASWPGFFFGFGEPVYVAPPPVVYVRQPAPVYVVQPVYQRVEAPRPVWIQEERREFRHDNGRHNGWFKHGGEGEFRGGGHGRGGKHH